MKSTLIVGANPNTPKDRVNRKQISFGPNRNNAAESREMHKSSLTLKPSVPQDTFVKSENNKTIPSNNHNKGFM